MSTADGRVELLEIRLDAFDRRLRAIETWATREQGFHMTIPANPQRRTELLPPRPSPTVPPPARREQPCDDPGTGRTCEHRSSTDGSRDVKGS
jgi:hypothetical protein